MPQPDAGYERDDVITRTARWWGAYLFAFLVIGLIGCLVAYALLSPHPFDGHVEGAANRRIPGQPRLQDNLTARTDIAALRRRENEALSTGGESVVVPGARRIPIAQAIDRMAAQGLPSHPGTPAPPPEPIPALPESVGGQP